MNTEAIEAASFWQGTELRMLRNRENAVYAMQTPRGPAALRLHRQGYQQEAAIRSELWWCGALAARGVAVPMPLSAQNGASVMSLANGRFASAIAWVDGDPLGEAGQLFTGSVQEQIDQHFALGRLVAEVHSATDALVLPSDFSRPAWDRDGLIGETPLWGRFWEHPALTDEDAKTLCNARDFLRERLQDYAANGGDYGLVHADVLRENVLVNDHSVSLIDFDDSGFGFRLYDLGTVMSQNLFEPEREAIAEALSAGYATLRPLDPNMVPLFTLARVLASVGWVAPRLAPDDPIHKSHIARATRWATRLMGAKNHGFAQD